MLKSEKVEKKNPFFEKLKGYLGKEVKVVLKSHPDHNIYGKLVSVNFVTMNFIIEGETEDYVIRDDISYISVEKGD